MGYAFCGAGRNGGCQVVGLDKIHEIVERVAASSGLEVVEVELRGGGKARMLRVRRVEVSAWAGTTSDLAGNSNTSSKVRASGTGK